MFYGEFHGSTWCLISIMQASLATKALYCSISAREGRQVERRVKNGIGQGLKTKPNTWKDFNSCAEWLINSGYTNAKKLAGTILISWGYTHYEGNYRKT